MNVLMAP
jgi:hypothetical protein